MTTCTQCGAEKDAGARLPMGWKRVGESILCGKCKLSSYALRAVTMRIVSPVGCGWPELREALRESFTLTTQAANWTMRQLAAHDAGIDPATGKLGKFVVPTPDGQSLYLGVATRFDVDTGTAGCIVQAVQAKYRACRLDMQRGKVSLPTIRYPHPIPVHNKTWSVREGEDGGLVLRFPLGRLRDARERNYMEVRLSGGVNYRRQLADVRRIIKGEAVQGQLDILESGTYPNTKLLAKLVAWFPRAQQRADGWAAALHTGGDAFVTLYNDERRAILRWNADHVRRRIAAQDDQMQRLREDLKAERRLGRDRDGILARMADLRDAHAHYMHSFCHEVSAQVIGHLARRRCGLLMVVDADKSYMPRFPWHKFRTMLADKANRVGIEIASGDASTESPAPLEEVSQ